MFFFFRKPKLVVDAFTKVPQVHEHFPVETANHFIPDWWKRVPKEYISQNTGQNAPPNRKLNTIRRCSGIVDYYNSNSIVIPLWMSCIFEYGENPFTSKAIFSTPDPVFGLKYQDYKMRGEEYLKNWHQFKFSSPWRFKEKTGVNFHFTQCFYNFEHPDEVIIPPAIINYKYQHSSEVNIFVKKPPGKEIYRIEFDAGNPLVHLTPITEKKLELRTHLVSDSEYEALHSKQMFFNNSYNRMKKIQEKRESREKKCPFGFS